MGLRWSGPSKGKKRHLFFCQRSTRRDDLVVVPVEHRDAIARNEFVQRQILLRLLVALARRPLRAQVGFDTLRTVQALRQLPLRRMQVLFHLARQVLRDIPCSVFWANIRTVLCRSVYFAFLDLTHGSPLFSLPGL